MTPHDNTCTATNAMHHDPWQQTEDIEIIISFIKALYKYARYKIIQRRFFKIKWFCGLLSLFLILFPLIKLWLEVVSICEIKYLHAISKLYREEQLEKKHRNIFIVLSQPGLGYSGPPGHCRGLLIKWNDSTCALFNFDVFIMYCTIRLIWQFPLCLIKYLLSPEDDNSYLTTIYFTDVTYLIYK